MSKSPYLPQVTFEVLYDIPPHSDLAFKQQIALEISSRGGRLYANPPFLAPTTMRRFYVTDDSKLNDRVASESVLHANKYGFVPVSRDWLMEMLKRPVGSDVPPFHDYALQRSDAPDDRQVKDVKLQVMLRIITSR